MSDKDPQHVNVKRPGTWSRRIRLALVFRLWLFATAVTWLLLATYALVEGLGVLRIGTAECSTVGCSLTTDVASTVISLAAIVSSVELAKRLHQLWSYRRNGVERRIDRLLPSAFADHTSHYPSHKGLVRDLLDQLRRFPESIQVVTGYSGAGKTAFARYMAENLGSYGYVVVVLWAHEHQLPLSVDTAARDVFLSSLEGWGAADAGLSLWSTLVKRNRVVVVIDGLHDLAVPGRSLTEPDLGASRKLPVIATSSPDELAGALRAGAFPLPPAAPSDRLIEKITDATPAVHAKALDKVLSEVVRVTRMDRVLVYYQICLELARVAPQRIINAHTAVSGRKLTMDSMRGALLAEWFKAWEEGELDGISDGSRWERKAALELASRAALYSLPAFGGVRRFSELAERVRPKNIKVDGEPVDLDAAWRLALALDLVRETHGYYRFSRPVFRVALAARRADDTPPTYQDEAWRVLCDGVFDQPTAATLRLAAAQGNANPAAVVEALIKRAERATEARPDVALNAASTAVRISQATTSYWQQKAVSCLRLVYSQQQAPVDARLRALDALNTLATEEALLAIFELPQAGSYEEIERAVERLSERPPESFNAIKDTVNDLVQEAPAGGIDENQEPPYRMVAHVLPTLTYRLASDKQLGQESLNMVQSLHTLVSEWRTQTIERGLSVEYLLAEGLKHAFWDAAVERPGDKQDSARPDPESPAVATRLVDLACKLAKGGHHWYTRLLAVQAVALGRVALGQEANQSPCEPEKTLETAPTDEFAFVKEAAWLAQRCQTSADVRRFIWMDENVEISRSWTELDDDAALLLGKTVLLMNLLSQESNERNASNDRKAREREQISSNKVPACLTDGAALFGELTSGDTCVNCNLHLCPYRLDSQVAHVGYMFRGHPHHARCERLEKLTRRPQIPLPKALSPRGRTVLRPPRRLTRSTDASRMWEEMAELQRPKQRR